MVKVMGIESIFEYDHKRKILNGLTFIGFFVFAAFIISLYFLYFKNLPIFNNTFVDAVLTFFKTNIANYTLLGVFMLAFVGGLFFVPLPMEVLFATYLVKNPNTALVITLYFIGITLGYGLNVVIGNRFSNFSRSLISTKKFYQLKSTINRYGKYAVFITNVFPLPSQQVSFILGVFKYNKAKFFAQFWAGQAVKLAVITGFVLLFK